MRQLQRVPSWFPIAGYCTGVVTLLFFMALVIASVFDHTVPQGGRFAVIVVLALGAAMSVTFLGGEAAARGDIPIPFSKTRPLAFSATGGISVLIVLLALGYVLYVKRIS